MSGVPAYQERGASSGSVIPLHHSWSPEAETGGGGFSPALSEELLGELRDWKERMESLVSDIYYRTVFGQPAVADNPFDAVYISRLTPDPISPGDLERIRRHAHVEDLSDRLSFADEWED